MPQIRVIPEGVKAPDALFTVADLRKHYAEVNARLRTSRVVEIPITTQRVPTDTAVTVWASIPASNYLVSSCGQVKHRITHKLRKLRKTTNGYPCVNYWSERKLILRTVHSIVAEVFIGPRPEGLEVRHLDGNRENNRVANLAYGTKAQNAADRERHGRTMRGQENGNAVISDEDVKRIRDLYEVGAANQYELARVFGISQSQVSNIVSWRQRCGAPKPRILVSEIITSVADYFGVTVDEMKSPCRQHRLVRPRQVAMFLARKLTSASYPQLARALGRTDHTTAIHGAKVIAARVQEDTDLAKDVAGLQEHLEGPRL